MATFHLLKSKTLPLTRELAEEFRDMEPSPTERELNPARVRYLQEQAGAGRLVNFNWATAQLDEKVLRMNGNHSSNMLCSLDGTFPRDLFVHRDDYKVDNIEGLADLFRQFDSRKSSRTSGDVSGAWQNLFPQLQDVPRAIGKIGIEGIVWYLRTIEGGYAPTGDDQYHLFNVDGYHPFLRWLGQVFSIKTPELKKVQVVASMYATFISNETEARKFWEQVARGGVEFEESAPSTVLDNWLKALKDREVGEHLKPAEYYQGCVYAWNAYRDDKPIKDIRHDTRKSWYKPSE